LGAGLNGLLQSCDLPVELGDDLAHGLGGAGGGGDDVLGGAASVSPELTGGPVHRLLGGGDGVDGALEGGNTRYCISVAMCMYLFTCISFLGSEYNKK